MGIVSTKFTDTLSAKANSGDVKVVREGAWLDMTLNRGNSGGPIIKIGTSYVDDEVIGLATFILSPYAQAAQRAFEITKNPGVDLRFSSGFSQSDINQLFALALTNSSYGISGCVSIDYFHSFYSKYFK
jgi:serine protease Do